MRSWLYSIQNGLVFTALLPMLFLMMLPACLLAGPSVENMQNRIVSVAYDKGGVLISTESAVDGRYTVYDSVDPLRVIVDFSDMQVVGLDPVVDISDDLIHMIRTSSFDLSSGQLGRIEILLTRPVKYEAVVVDKGLRINLQDEANGTVAASVQGKELNDASPMLPEQASLPAKVIGSVQVKQGQAVIFADGPIGQVKHFTLSKPNRLVVDIHDVVTGFRERSFQLNSGFSKLRVGAYPDKVRFVFDAESQQLPEYSFHKQGNTFDVIWHAEPGQAASSPVSVPSSRAIVGAKPAAKDVRITDIDFSVENAKSILKIGLSGSAEIEEPVARGNIIQFGIKGASISRQHRRTIDPSVFPSSVRLITPYTVRDGGVESVRFAIEMKAMQPYELRKERDAVFLVLDNGSFGEPLPMGVVHKVLPGHVVSASQQAAKLTPTQEDGDPGMTAGAPVAVPLQMDSDTITIQRKKQYAGEKISLVFDDADIRNILQLIGEVSDLNIIVGDDVKGTLTLRLIDVPWDQALDLVLEIRELGKLQEGNVLRILPLSKIRQMQQEQFAAARAKEKLEDLVTDLVPVNYTDVEGLVDACKKRLSDRGKVIGDVRDKKLIITDIPSVVADVKQLVALLDTPVRQVLIEARIVEANATFARDLGVNWGLSYQDNPGSGIDGNDASIGMGGSFIGLPVDPGEVSSGIVSGLTFGQVGVDKAVLDLRLAALEQSGNGRIISTPRVSTLNGEEAEVAQGTEIPYLSVSEEGTKTEFKKAELSLKVTPEINPDGSVILEIEARNDSRGAPAGEAEAPAIDTKRATTKVLVKDGETTVIGGIFIQDKSESVSGVPWLMNVPVIGHLFKSRSVSEERRELLVFITPRILD